MDLINEALRYEQQKLSLKTTSDRIVASKKLKTLILGLNEIYKKTKNPELMDIMKRLTVIKRKVEKRLNLRITI
ncbi:hypothetical protein SAMN06265371_11098 [Lutibacter agarilyticus]|uniref:Uncharacterized protein n=1 Tax=Lutibacter agarilyticus TaxID=1109740 RepID=A0A238YS61_9FLAO|nr:hypothetical protein [Lutibacter agarilyticus]SNR73443.1 hypothetical protein SAMN06265371_11098 [Lutibacter agarilyticus]